MARASETAAERAAGLLGQGRASEACAVLETALAQGDDDPAATRLLVRCLAQAGDLNAALDRQLALVPRDLAGTDAQARADALAAAQLAQLAMDIRTATGLSRALVERDPADGEAAHLLATLTLWSEGPEAARAALAGVRVVDASPHLLAEMLAFDDDPSPALLDRAGEMAEAADVPVSGRAELLLALAQHHDRTGDADAAWTAAARGKALAPPRTAQDWRAVLAAHTRIFRETDRAKPLGGPRHVYLLGTPRSGQSLVQSILAAAPGVVSLGERGALLQHVLYRTGEIVRLAPPARAALFRQLGEADRRGIARLASEAELVVDKSPLHLAVAGSLARVHPDAAFAAVVRDPADTALSIWLRGFPPVYDYANDFGAILGQIDFALDALAAWHAEGLDIALIDHAALVSDPADTGRSLFDRLGLAWHDGYLAPENRTQAVPTFSAAQVRQPISPAAARSAVGYARHLAPHAAQIVRLREKTAALLAG